MKCVFPKSRKKMYFFNGRAIKALSSSPLELNGRLNFFLPGNQIKEKVLKKNILRTLSVTNFFTPQFLKVIPTCVI